MIGNVSWTSVTAVVIWGCLSPIRLSRLGSGWGKPLHDITNRGREKAASSCCLLLCNTKMAFGVWGSWRDFLNGIVVGADCKDLWLFPLFSYDQTKSDPFCSHIIFITHNKVCCSYKLWDNSLCLFKIKVTNIKVLNNLHPLRCIMEKTGGRVKNPKRGILYPI